MFFESDRAHFFRPLNGKRRELVAVCLRAIYERLHGPSCADYQQNLTRDGLRDLLAPAIQAHANDLPADDAPEQDELSDIDSNDTLQLASALIRVLLKDGWLETFGDRAGLVTAYRFTRAGKLFAEALWASDRPRARSRQRNVRGCRNALEALLRNGDANDLIDAYDYAEKIINDLSEGVDYFKEMLRRLMTEAAQTPWDEFMGFLSRFEKDTKKQLTVENVSYHRQAIRSTIDKLHGIDEHRRRELEQQVKDATESWLDRTLIEGSLTNWMLGRIEEMVDTACNSKQPELVKAMNTYVSRTTGIVQQARLMHGQHRHGFAQAIAQLASLDATAQDAFLHKLAPALCVGQVRLLDPTTLRLTTRAQRKKALAITATPFVTREAKREGAMQRAVEGAFALSNEDVLVMLRAELRKRARPLRLSELPLETAIDVLRAMQAVEASRSSDTGIVATRLPTKLHSPHFSSTDYQFELKKT